MRRRQGWKDGWVLVLALLAAVRSAAAQRVLTLEDALQIAMRNSPNIRRALYNLERSRYSLNAQMAALKSRFSLSITPIDYSKYRNFNTDFSAWFTTETKQVYGTFTISQPIPLTDGTLSLVNRLSWRDAYSENPFAISRSRNYDDNLYVSFQQPIFTYNRTKLALRELELDLENAQLNYDIQRLALEKEVTQAFYNLYLQKMRVDIAQEELQNQEISYGIIQNKVQAGLAAEEELYQAELNLATSRSKVFNEQTTYENLLDNFKYLIGLPLEDSVAVTADIAHRVVPVDLQLAVAHGLRYRMELRQRQIDIQNSLFDLIQVSAQNEFRGNITLSYGVIGTDESVRDIFEVPTKNQRVSLSLEIPLWDWGEKESRIRASEAVVKTRRLSMEETQTNIVIGIRQAYRQLKNLEIQVEIAQQNVRNAQLTYDINLERYRNGDLTSMDLSLYQNQLSQAKLNLVKSLIDYKIALLDLKVQSLWDFEKGRSVLSVDRR
ncbi:MAG: TolC family protein [candidate division KSB1 bacterium]|nr:TolC family protein [candidate division KSB1 bacterium]